MHHYNINNEDVMIQSFSVWQKPANEFSLRIIRTYSASGHSKGAIDAMPSFVVKNVLRTEIVT